jgi:hypothetical protein
VALGGDGEEVDALARRVVVAAEDEHAEEGIGQVLHVKLEFSLRRASNEACRRSTTRKGPTRRKRVAKQQRGLRSPLVSFTEADGGPSLEAYAPGCGNDCHDGKSSSE